MNRNRQRLATGEDLREYLEEKLLRDGNPWSVNIGHDRRYITTMDSVSGYIRYAAAMDFESGKTVITLRYDDVLDWEEGRNGSVRCTCVDGLVYDILFR